MKPLVIVVLALGVSALPQGTALASEWRGFVSGEVGFFAHEPTFPEQEHHRASVSVEPEYYHEWKNRNSVTIAPFYRVDGSDPERTHGDLREAYYLWPTDRFEVGVGLRKIFWGVTESQHLVDIVNQTDLVEFPDGEDKLGQPMLSLSIPEAWGTVDVFVMPYFRERTFPGRNGRLRTALPVDTDQALYESSAEAYHVDVVARYSHFVGDLDLGLSYFDGTGRDPRLLPGTDANGSLVLIPFYEQIRQTGFDTQLITGEWVWKLEAIHRVGQGNPYGAWTAGFEYMIVRLFGTVMDLGVISEWLYDTRGDDATTPYENDLAGGLRVAVNDVDSSEVLLLLIQNLGSSARTVSLQASRRVKEHWTVDAELFVFSGYEAGEPLYSIRDDDVLQVTVAYHF